MKQLFTVSLILVSLLSHGQPVWLAGGNVQWDEQVGHGPQTGLWTRPSYPLPTALAANNNFPAWQVGDPLETIPMTGYRKVFSSLGRDQFFMRDNQEQIVVFRDTLHTPIAQDHPVGSQTVRFDLFRGFGHEDKLDVSQLGITHPDQLYYHESSNYGYLWASTQRDSLNHSTVGWAFPLNRNISPDKVNNIVYAVGQTWYCVKYKAHGSAIINVLADSLEDAEIPFAGYGHYFVWAFNPFVGDYEVGQLILDPPLPVTFLGIESDRDSIYFMVADEEGVDRYEVQTMADEQDAQVEIIYTIQATGKERYAAPLAVGTRAYRIQAVDYDGGVTHSNWTIHSHEGSIYQRVGDIITFSYGVGHIYSQDGRMVAKGIEGRLDMTALPSGTYVLILGFMGARETFRILKY